MGKSYPAWPAQGRSCTVLDHDAEMIETARNFGYRVFYGDATRLVLLRTAGAAKDKVLVAAADDVTQSLTIVGLVREHFPQLEIVARARDVTHWNKLRDRNASSWRNKWPKNAQSRLPGRPERSRHSLRSTQRA